jgi:hypothetical protein
MRPAPPGCRQALCVSPVSSSSPGGPSTWTRELPSVSAWVILRPRARREYPPCAHGAVRADAGRDRADPAPSDLLATGRRREARGGGHQIRPDQINSVELHRQYLDLNSAGHQAHSHRPYAAGPSAIRYIGEMTCAGNRRVRHGTGPRRMTSTGPSPQANMIRDRRRHSHGQAAAVVEQG